MTLLDGSLDGEVEGRKEGIIVGEVLGMTDGGVLGTGVGSTTPTETAFTSMNGGPKPNSSIKSCCTTSDIKNIKPEASSSLKKIYRLTRHG